MDVTDYPRYLFWNYAPTAMDLPEKVVVRRVLLYGDLDEMFRLRKEVSPQRLREIADELRSSGRFLKRANFIEKILLGES